MVHVGEVIVTGYLYRFGAWLMHLFMIQVDYRLMHGSDYWYRLFGIGWCMVDALFYGTGLLQVEVQLDAWFGLLV